MGGNNSFCKKQFEFEIAPNSIARLHQFNHHLLSLYLILNMPVVSKVYQNSNSWRYITFGQCIVFKLDNFLATIFCRSTVHKVTHIN